MKIKNTSPDFSSMNRCEINLYLDEISQDLKAFKTQLDSYCPEKNHNEKKFSENASKLNELITTSLDIVKLNLDYLSKTEKFDAQKFSQIEQEYQQIRKLAYQHLNQFIFTKKQHEWDIRHP